MTLITNTSVVTARMTPRRVRKLRSLWARRASNESLKVSWKVIQPFLTRCRREADTSTRPSSGGTLVKLSMGETPKLFSCIFKDEPPSQIVPYLDVLGVYKLSAEAAIISKNLHCSWMLGGLKWKLRGGNWGEGGGSAY